MNFVFSNPGVLWGLLAVAIPVAIHLLLSRQPKVEYWGATRFLKKAIERRQAQLQVQSYSQLLVRILIIGLIMLAAADPRSDSARQLVNAPEQVHRLLIVDVSMSMATTFEGESRLAEVVRQIGSLVAESSPGDSWQLLLHGTQSEPVRFRVPIYESELMIEELSELLPTFQAANLAETLQRALDLIDEFPGNQNEVLLWTDLAAIDWERQGSPAYEVNARLEQLSRAANVTIIDVGKKSVSNLGITDVRARTATVSVGERAVIDASVKNFSSIEQHVAVRALINSEIIAEKTLTLAPGVTEEAQFEIVMTRPGVAKCEVRIDHDALLADNQRSLAFDVIDTVHVLIVEEAATSEELRQSDFLQLALNVSGQDAPEAVLAKIPRYSVVVVSPQVFRTTALSDFDVLLVCGLSEVTNLDAQRLRDFVNRGGGVLFSMSNTVSLNQYNQQLGPQGAGLLPVQLLKRVEMDESFPIPFQIGKLKQDHPLVAPFELHPESGLATTRIYSYVTTEEISDETSHQAATCLVGLESDAPLIVSHRFGLGEVYLVTTAFNTEWGSWVLWPSFLPMLQRAVDDLAQHDDFIVSLVIGQELPAEALRFDQFRTIRNSDGRTVWENDLGVDSFQNIFPEAFNSPGIFFLQAGEREKLAQVLTLQPDTTESDLRHLDSGKLLSSSLMKDLAVDIYDDVSQLALNRRGIRSAEESYLARWLIFVAVLLVLVDQLFAFRSSLAMGALFGILTSSAVSVYSGHSPVLKVSLIVICTLLCAYLGASLNGKRIGSR